MSTKEPGLIPFTFKDTGRTVLLRRISPYLILELQKSFPPPEPPKQKVNYGDGVDRFEANPNNPEYLQQKAKYDLEFQEHLQIIIVKRGVVIELDDKMKGEVAELREFWQTEFGKKMNGDDRMVYILNICVGSDKDLEELLDAITRRSQPTDAVIKEAL